MPNYIKIQAEIMSNRAITDAVTLALNNLNISYDDIALINYSQTGVVGSIQTDTIKLDKIKLDIIEVAEEEIAKIHDCDVDIPLGAFTDISVLSNYGPEININMSIEGSFNAEIVTSFEQAGLNQTIHHISLVLYANIITTSLDYSGEIEFSTDYEIAQTVIIGAIPNSYGSWYKTE